MASDSQFHGPWILNRYLCEDRYPFRVSGRSRPITSVAFANYELGAGTVGSHEAIRSSRITGRLLLTGDYTH